MKYMYMDQEMSGSDRTSENVTYDDATTQLGSSNVQGAIQKLSTKGDNINSRIDNIIAQSGTSDTEVVDARANTETGTTYTTLHERLDTEFSTLKDNLDSLGLYVDTEGYLCQSLKGEDDE